MATRLYFESTSGGVPITPPAPDATDWTHQGLEVARYLRRTLGGSPMVTQTANYDASDHLPASTEFAIVAQYVSDRLDSQNLAQQTVRIQCRCMETAALPPAGMRLCWKVYLIDNAGAIVPGGTLIPITVQSTQFDGPPTPENRSGAASTPATPVSISATWRLCVEVGFAGHPGSTPVVINGHNASIVFGDDSGTDLPINQTTTAPNNPWIEFDPGINFIPPPGPRVHATQDTIEGLVQNTPQLSYATQDSVEALESEVAMSRVTQDSVEALYGDAPLVPGNTYVTQDSLELLYAPVDVYVVVSGPPAGQISRVHGAQGQISTVRAIQGQISSARAKQGQVNRD